MNRKTGLAQHEKMLQAGYIQIGQGYCHNVYEKDGLIYKCLKPEMYMKNDYHKFLHEQAAMDILRMYGYPVAEVIRVAEKKEILDECSFLVEKKAVGKNYPKDIISDEFMEKVFGCLMDTTQIKMSFFGDTMPSKGKGQSWKYYLKSKAAPYTEEIRKNYRLPMNAEQLEKLLDSVEEEAVTPSFLIMDSNPENFFFDENGRISSIIDIDHPICGDALYQLAAILAEWGERARPFIERTLPENRKECFMVYLLHIMVTDLILRIRIKDLEIDRAAEDLRKLMLKW